MRSIRSPWRSGRRASAELARRAAIVGAIAVTMGTGCNYGFQGGGFPPHVETIYIEPFDNETVQFGLEQQVYDAMTSELPGQLGVQTAGRQSADAIVSGTVSGYDDQAQNVRGGDPTTGGANVVAHQVQLRVAVRILDVRRNVILWESSGTTGQGTYQPGSESDRAAVEEAITDLVRKIVDGAQSQW